MSPYSEDLGGLAATPTRPNLATSSGETCFSVFSHGERERSLASGEGEDL